jgi:hypothetical protein
MAEKMGFVWETFAFLVFLSSILNSRTSGGRKLYFG